MSQTPKLLVVDDDEGICHACRRIFSPQGYQVETASDAQDGLDWAIERDYVAVLLDIKMPKLDGIEFLERLRAKKADLPVLIMTGYPNIPNATAAIRLGIADYITKPFAPEEITRAVQRMVKERGPGAEGARAAAEGPPTSTAKAHLFYDEAWLRLEEDGSAYVGAVLAGLRGVTVESVRLPRIGEVVYQGLPLAGVSVAGRAPVVVRAPISGVVAGINESLARNPAPLLTDPCGDGWIACIWMTRFEQETAHCKLRRVVVANVGGPALQAQSQALAALGCQVHGVASREELLAALKEPGAGVAVIDAASFADQGPDLVGQVNLLAPAWRVVVVASPDGRWETAYRQHRIFYYAVDPFADNEIVEILDAAFRSQEVPLPKTSPASEPGESLSSITTTNRNGHKVRLIAAPGLLRRNEGLGHEISRRLLERSMRVAMMPGEADLEPTAILKAAGTCDRLMVLTAKDSGQLPGSLARDTKAEIGPASGESARRVTTLTVQPDAAGTFAEIDPRIITTLAEHLVREMASY